MESSGEEVKGREGGRGGERKKKRERKGGRVRKREEGRQGERERGKGRKGGRKREGGKEGERGKGKKKGGMEGEGRVLELVSTACAMIFSACDIIYNTIIIMTSPPLQ